MQKHKKQFFVGLALFAFICLFAGTLYISAQVQHLAVMAILIVSTALILIDLRCANVVDPQQSSDQANSPF